MGNGCCYAIRFPENEIENGLELLKQMVLDSAQFDSLLSIIDERLIAIAEKKENAQQKMSTEKVGSSSMFDSCVSFGKNLVMMTSKRAERNHRTASLKSDYNLEIRQMAIEVVKGASQIQLLAAGVCVMGYLLDEEEQLFKNRDQCIQLLRSSCALARRLKNVPADGERPDKAINLIFDGCVLCVRLMESHRLSQASVGAKEIDELESEIRNAYTDLTPHFPLPTPGQDPQPVGIDEARDDVVKLLDLKDQSIRSVVLYGLGGIGKTTLATAVVSSPNLDLSVYKCCRIDIHQHCSEAHVKQLQEQVLRELFDKNIQLANSEEGNIILSNLFREATSQPVFLFIDNALRRSDLAKFLPDDLSCLPSRSRILITTRKLDETDMIEGGGVKRYKYSVNPLSDAASRDLLRRKASDGADNFFDRSLDIDGLVDICGGVPLVLHMVGSNLHKLGNNALAYESIIEFLKDTLVKGEGNLSEKVVDVVYNTLEEDLYKDAFLDIAAFFNNWDERMVGYIVGEVALQALKEAALVKVTKEGKVVVHDIVQARGRKFSQDDRLTDHRSLQYALGDTQKLANLKGIWLPPPDDSDEFQLQAKDLELMKRSLRILHLGERNRLDGESKEIFPNLRLLHITGDLGMELTNLERLAVLQADLGKYDELPDSLRLSSLRMLNLTGSRLSCLPNIFGRLSRLEDLNISHCKFLQKLPEGFRDLKFLRYLCMSGCSNLEMLTEDFGQLKSLTHLDMSWCCNLLVIPDGFGQLKSLTHLNMSGCRDLWMIPDGFGQLKSLTYLDMSGCTNLEMIPDDFGLLGDLEKLNISKCRWLECLPESFGQLSRLKDLNISNCEQLSRLPDGFGQLEGLTYLDMSGCSKLEEVSDDFEKLSSVCAVNASNCSILDGKAIDKLVEIKSLIVLNIQESPMLVNRWKEVKESYPLVVVDEVPPGCYHEHPLSTALFHKESKFLDADGDVFFAELSLDKGQVAFVLSIDLSGPSFETVKDNIAELASQGFQIVYVCVGQTWKGNIESIRQSNVHLPHGARTWIAPNEKLNILAGYSIFKLISPRGGPTMVSNLHTLIASACVSLDRKGQKYVNEIKLKFPVSGNVQAFEDVNGGFSRLFFRMRQMEDHVVSFAPETGKIGINEAQAEVIESLDLKDQSTTGQGENMSQVDEVNLTKLLEVEDVNHLDEVISFIDARLNAILTNKPEESTHGAVTTTSVRVASSIKYGYHFLGKVINRAQKHYSKILSSETREAVSDTLKETNHIHWIVAGLGVVAYVLHQMDKVSTNWNECIQFLCYMCGLAKHINQLDNHTNQEKLIDVVAFIVNGSFFCISRMQSNNLSRFLYASSNSEELKRLQSYLFQTYLDLALDGILSLLNLKASLPPTMEENRKAVGIDEARDEVVNLLDLKDQSIRSVVLYGLGGIGKTILATIVVSSLRHELGAYKCCRINIEDDCSEAYVKQLQEQVLRDLFNQGTQLRDSIEGENHLLKLFREETCQPFFLFIDNALRGSYLAKFLPEDLSCLPKRSRILITTRKLDETDIIEEGGVMRCAYGVKPLSNEASKLLLRPKALRGADNSLDRSKSIDGLVKICSGVPLVLKFASTQLRKLGSDVRACESTIEYLKDILVTGERNLSKEVVDVVYNTLEEDFQDAFLDIAAFFNNWDERIVGYIVGEVALQAIKDAALVKTEKGKVIVDDIVQARGRKLSVDNRITDHRSLQRVLHDKQKLAKVKGIWLPPPDGSDEFLLEEEDLVLMQESLRILHLGERNRLDGESVETFPNLRLLDINGDLRIELTKLEKLTVLQTYSENSDGVKFTTKFQTCLPDNFGHLSLLKMLNLTGSKLICLPNSFCLLSRLEELNISNCEHLRRLPDGFGHLKSLTYLDMAGCSNLEMLSDDFEKLSSVCAVNASNCPRLDGKEMDKLVQMKSLLVLNIQESPMLAKRWKKVKEIHALIVQDGESRLHEHSLSSALFHKESKFLHAAGDVHFAELSPGPGQVAFVLSMRDLSGPSFKMVKQKITELASQRFQIVYVRVGSMLEQNINSIRQSLELLPGSTRAWIAPDEKWNIVAGYSIFQLISPHEGSMMVSSLHTLIASAWVTGDEKWQKNVKDIKLTFPLSGDDKELKDLDGGFSRLFFPITQMNEKFGQVGEVRYGDC